MNAEIIAIGDELTSGQRLDTNSQWLSQQLAELGIRVLYHTTVGDDLDANVRVLRHAIERAEVVVSTGGLGPTADDLTRDALAETTGKKLERDEAALAHIRSLFSRRKREMPQQNVGQAMFPQGSKVIPNPHGTAPGIELRLRRNGQTPCYLFALPGVPAEMREMWAKSVGPALASAQGDARRIIRIQKVRCFGVGESDLEQMLPGMIRRGRLPTVGITASKATLTLRIAATAESEQACDALMAPTLTTIHQCLGKLVFGHGEDELEDGVVRLLRARGDTLATGEVGSGGTLASWLSEADEERQAFAGGVVVRPAGSNSSTLQEVAANEPRGEADTSSGTDSARPFDRDVPNFDRGPQAVAEYADKTREWFAASIGLAIGPFPQSDSTTKSPGKFCVGLATPAGTRTREFSFSGHPEIVRVRAIKLALNALRLLLLEDK